MARKSTLDGIPLDWREAITLSVPVAGKILGIGRGAAYQAARRGDIPVLIVGGRKRVPVKKLLTMIGE